MGLSRPVMGLLFTFYQPQSGKQTLVTAMGDRNDFRVQNFFYKTFLLLETSTGNVFCCHTIIHNADKLGYNIMKGTVYFVFIN
jgi:hypothetical protein